MHVLFQIAARLSTASFMEAACARLESLRIPARKWTDRRLVRASPSSLKQSQVGRLQSGSARVFPAVARLDSRKSTGTILVPMLALLSIPAFAQMQLVPEITTVAGNGTNGYSGDGGAATSAEMNDPAGLGFDASGNIYITEYLGCRIRKVTIATGKITTVAGTGTCANTADGGQAASAAINQPNHRVAFDSSGNYYFAESGNNKIRKVNISTGVITTVAGNGTAGSSGDGGAATSAELNNPKDVFIDGSNNLFIADGGNNKIRKVTNSTGYISTVAGNGTAGSSGDGAAATSAELSDPEGVTLDSAGNIYIGDSANNRIRKVTISTGYISTVAGNGTNGYTGDGGAATSAEIGGYFEVAVDASGNIYIGDWDSNRIREVNIGTGIINTIAGNGTAGYTGNSGPATSAELNAPNGTALDSSGNLYFADNNSGTVRKIWLNYSLPTTALGSSSAAQNLFLATTSNETLTSFTATQSMGSKQEFTAGTITGCTVNGSTSNPSGTICTVPITFTPAYPGVRNVPLTVVTGTGNIAFGLSGTGTGPLVAMTPGVITTVAGNGTAGSTGNGGAATSAELNGPQRAVVDNAGNIYIADYSGNEVQKVTAASGNIGIVAGNGTGGYSGDGGAATSTEIHGPSGIGIDGSGNIYIADKKNYRIRKVTVATGNISTVAGNGTSGYTGNEGAATSAELKNPSGNIAFDSAGNFYFSDGGNNVVREVNISTGIISTVAGNGTAGYSGDGGAATSAQLSSPGTIALDASNNIYIADFGNNVVRKVAVSTGYISTIAGNGTAGYAGDGGAATSAELHSPGGVALDAAGNVYIGDAGNNRVRMLTVSTGILTTVAGNGTAGYSGDSGAAISAELSNNTDAELDSVGNLYIADFSNNRVRKVTVNQSSLSYPTSTAYGAVDSTDDPLTTTVTNIGNSTLTIAVPSSGTNPSVASNFALDAATTCPELSTISSAATLASGSNCTYPVDFEPTTVGSINGSVVLTDNSLGVTGTTQTISASGTAIQATPSITFTVSNQTYGVAPFAVSATSNSAGVITYSVVSGPATISGSTVTITGVGTVVLQASQAANGNYTAGTQNASFTVSAAAPSITFNVSNQTYGVAPFAVSATSNSAGAITYSVVSGPATISGSTVTITGVGTVVLQASQAANGNYTAGTQNASFTVSAAAPTITFNVSNQTYGVAPFAVSATSNSAGIITYSVVSGPATISGSTVTITGVGTVVLQASQGANGNYTAGTQNASFTVSAAAPTITFSVANKTYGVAPFAVSATSNSAGVITYSVVSGPATISGSTVTVTGIGTVVLQASQAANGNYTAGTQNASFTVSAAAPTINFNVSNQTYGVAPFAVSATSNSAGAITYSVVSGPATISGSTVTITGVGTVVLQASQAANGNYTAGTQNATFTVSQATKTITFPQPTTPVNVNSTATLTATTSNSDPITYTVTSGTASISGSTITYTTAGTVTIQASSAATADYAAATPVSVSVTVNGAAGAYTAPTTNVGSTSATQTATVNIIAAGTLNTISVLTQGASGLDYAYITGGTCATGTSYTVGQACTVQYSFAPSAPGQRLGAVVLTSSAPAVLATSYLSGIGTGPAVIFPPGIVSTVAGNGTAGYSGDGGAATSAEINYPRDVAIDPSGNLYIADASNHCIRKVNSSGTISTFAGHCGTSGYTGDGGAATSAYLFNPGGVALDGAGNLYIADTNNNVVRMVSGSTGNISRVAGNYTATFAGDGGAATSASLNLPGFVAIDAAGNFYISDVANARVRMVTVSTGVITTFAGNGTAGYNGDGIAATSAEINSPGRLAFDAAGNLYIPEKANHRIRMVSASTSNISTVAGTGTQSYSGDGGAATSATLNQPNGALVDAAGDLYIADYGNSRIRVVNATTQVITTVVGNGTAAYSGDGGSATSAELNTPIGLALTGNGNLYIADYRNHRVRLVTQNSPASMSLASTVNGGTSAANYRTVQNMGNSTLTLNTIASSSGNFTLAGSLATCGASGQTLSASASCQTGVEFTPQSAGSLSGTITFTDNTANVASTTQVMSLSGTSTPATPVITWATPAPIPYGTALSSTQLNASSTVAGTFVYTPAAGAILSAGTQTLSVTFTPTDTTDYSTATQTVSLVVSKATPTITWATPSAITYGTALSATQLNASSTVAGTFVYTPASGTVLTVGTQTLSVTLTPTDTTDYTTATQTVSLVVNKATPTITWATQSPITYGTALSSMQLNASSTVAGTLVYTPASGTVLTAGTQTLSVTLTPTDTTDYTTATQTVSLVVNKATPTITWATPSPISYGTALSATQLNATSGGIAGVMAYTPAAGSTPSVGTQTLSVTFTPTDSTDYTAATQTVSLVVTKGSVTVNGASSLPVSRYGDTVNITFTFIGGGVTPTGTATLKDGATTLGTVPLAVGVATLSSSTLAAGVHTITAIYNGDSNYQ